MSYPGYPPQGQQAGGYPPPGGYPQGGGYPPQGGYSAAGPRTYYFIQHRSSGLYVDIDGGSRNPGTRVILWNKKSGDNDNQQWYSDPPSGTIRSKMHDFCLTTEGTLVVKPYQPGDPNQQLEWADTVIRSKQTPNRCLEVTGSGPAATLGIRDYNGNPNQVFAFELVPGGGAPSYPQGGQGGYPQGGQGYPQGGQGYPQGGQAQPYPQGGQGFPQAQPQQAPRRLFHIASELNGKVLDIREGNAAPGTQVVMWSKHPGNSKNQLWYTDPQGHILSALNDFSFISQAAGDNIRMKPHSSDPHQLWYVEGQKILNRAGLSLDIREGGQHDGAEVLSWKYGGSNNQHWKIQYV